MPTFLKQFPGQEATHLTNAQTLLTVY